jgi:hypothetical protein
MATGVGAGVDLGVGEGFGLGLGVGDGLGFGVGLATGLGVGEASGGLGVGLAIGLAVAEASGLAVGNAAVGLGRGDGIGSRVGVGIGSSSSVGLAIGCSVKLSVDSESGDGSAYGVEAGAANSLLGDGLRFRKGVEAASCAWTNAEKARKTVAMASRRMVFFSLSPAENQSGRKLARARSHGQAE